MLRCPVGGPDMRVGEENMMWQYIAAALAVATASAGIDIAPPVDTESADILEMQRERYERMTVPVTIQGQGPFRFMIDTGAQATVLSTILADQLELNNRQNAILVGMAGRQAIQTTEIPRFELGRRRFSILTAALVDRDNIGGADGILGLDSLQGQRVLLDFVDQSIAVVDPEDVTRKSGYDIIVKAREKLGQLIIADARVNGVPTAVIVDTGAQVSVGNLALLDRLRRGRHLGTTEMTDINGLQMSGVVREGEMLELGDVQMRNFPIMFADSPPFHALGLSEKPALVLGMQQLKAFRRVAIDFEKRRVMFDLPRSVRASDISRYSFGAF
ncbi:hypothetical protein GRI89_02925 [Altererythrobacter salegens]|uniref:Peptidase A2 domain-containing protein n=1 Tax=Croceibacterium salegens TaxID=1737568 RepID=A0A6I4SRQ6_9SPHN|nr:aspartyl protease family protein [Croceibacterium salegens]MXO58495.1 hypothetical protein [Croceibacterium salegens]